MEVNGHLLVVFSVFFLILFILNLMHEYEGSIKIQNMQKYNADISVKQSELNLQNYYTQLINTPEPQIELIANRTHNNNTVWPKEKIGPHAWNFLHVMAASYPWKPTAFEQEKMKIFLTLFGEFYPCKICGGHFLDMLKKHPIEATTREEFYQYICRLHNLVNKKLQKPKFDCSQIVQNYGGDQDGCGCDDDLKNKSLQQQYQQQQYLQDNNLRLSSVPIIEQPVENILKQNNNV